MEGELGRGEAGVGVLELLMGSFEVLRDAAGIGIVSSSSSSSSSSYPA